MEIISYVLEGELAHKDSMGNGSTIRPGDVQRMSAGTRRASQRVQSVADASRCTSCRSGSSRAQRDIEPSYEEKRFSAEEKRGRLRLIASPDRADGSVLIHQDARVYAGLFDGAESATLDVAPERRLYVHLARGALTVNEVELAAGDALKITATPSAAFKNGQQAEVIVFDLPGEEA